MTYRINNIVAVVLIALFALALGTPAPRGQGPLG